MSRFTIAAVVFALLVAGGGVAALLWHSSQTTAKETPPEAPPSREVPQGFKEYRNGRFGFFLFYSEFLTVTERQETATSYSIVFEDPATEAGFQIFAAHYPEPSISEERFQMDVPSGIRLEEEPTTVGGVEAVQFFSSDTKLGETREVWFIKNGYLFEVTTYKPLDRWLRIILDTWEFTR